MPSVTNSLQGLLDWFKDHNIQYNQELIEFCQDPKYPGMGIFVRAKQDIEPQVIARIPKESVLSAKNCGIANEISHLDGTLALTVAFLYEKSLKQASPWAGYIQYLVKEPLPLFWDPEDLEELQGTGLGDALSREAEYAEHDYNELVKPLGLDITFDDFIEATSIIMSRAFYVDPYHQDALLPLADCFNHQLQENVHFETDADVCDKCGENCCECYDDEEEEDWEDVDGHDDCCCHDEHDEHDEHEHEEEEEDDASQGSCPSLEEIDNEEQEEGEGDEHLYLDMQVVNTVPKGQEIFNTYGPLGNSMLLHRYGFILDNNPFTCVQFQEDDILELIPCDMDRLEFWGSCCLDIIEEMLEEMEIGQDASLYLSKQGPSYTLLLFIAICQTSDATFKRISTDDKACADFFIENIHKTCPLIKQLVQKRLEKYPTSLEQDQKLDLSGNKKLALQVRMEEKELLLSFIE